MSVLGRIIYNSCTFTNLAAGNTSFGGMYKGGLAKLSLIGIIYFSVVSTVFTETFELQRDTFRWVKFAGRGT